MPSQKDTEILIELRPLETLFSSLSDEKATEYCKHLQAFAIGVIRQAVDKAAKKWDRVSFPPVGFLVERCEEVTGGPRGIMSGEVYPWLKRDADIARSVSEYVANFFRISTIARDAEAAGFEHYLRAYLRAAAYVQAQIIHKKPNGVIVDWKTIEPENIGGEAAKWRSGWLKDAKHFAAKGSIDVAIPTNKIEEWKQRANRDSQTRDSGGARMSRKYGQSLAAAIPVADARYFNDQRVPESMRWQPGEPPVVPPMPQEVYANAHYEDAHDLD